MGKGDFHVKRNITLALFQRCVQEAAVMAASVLALMCVTV